VVRYTRVRAYKAVVKNHCPPDRGLLWRLPLAMRLPGPREALWHALIRRNYGANFERLARVKRRYDPGNLFRLNANVAPA